MVPPSAETPSQPAAPGPGSDPTGDAYHVSVTIDGRDLPLKPFLHDMMGGALEGLISGLRDSDVEQTLEITVTKKT